MRKISFIVLFALAFIFCQAQQKFSIHGKIKLVNKRDSIEVGKYIMPIDKDGTFELQGEVESPKSESISASGAYGELWLEAGNYFIDCEVVPIEGTKYHQLKIDKLKGPDEAELYHDFQSKIKTNFGLGNRKNIEKKDLNRNVTAYLDRVFKKYPDAKVLPSMLVNLSRRTESSHQVIRKYISMLDAEMQKSDAVTQLKNDLNQKDKLQIGTLFEDFQMKKNDDQPFKLSSLSNKKIIILDFWSSGCVPCRQHHPDLKELYKKYSDKGLEIVSISLDDDREKWLQAIKEDNINKWINVSDLKGWNTPLAKANFIDFIPFRVYLDGNLKIVQSSAGGRIFPAKDVIEMFFKSEKM